MRLSGVIPKAIALLSCAASVLGGGSSTPTILVDLEHSQFDQPEGSEAPSYVIPPTKALLLDARAFDFSKSLYPGVAPTAVQVLISNDRQYWAPWDPSRLVELSASTLQPFNNSPPFAGLKAGDSALIVIGAQRVEEKDQKIVLKVLWGAMLKVSVR